MAYPYQMYAKADYRRVYAEIGKAFQVKFEFADERITNLFVLQKIVTMIRATEFGIYDISGWNPNVALELGLAYGLGERAFIGFDPSKTPVDEVPSDLRGRDRLQYTSYAELTDKVEALISAELPVPTTHTAETQLDDLRKQLLSSMAPGAALGIVDIAKLLGISVDLAKVVVRPLVSHHDLQLTGVRRGAKYSVVNSAPSTRVELNGVAVPVIPRPEPSAPKRV